MAIFSPIPWRVATLAVTVLFLAAAPVRAEDSPFPQCFQNRPRPGAMGLRITLTVPGPRNSLLGRLTMVHPNAPEKDLLLSLEGSYVDALASSGKERHMVQMFGPDLRNRRLALTLTTDGGWDQASVEYQYLPGRARPMVKGREAVKSVPCTAAF